MQSNKMARHGIKPTECRTSGMRVDGGTKFESVYGMIQLALHTVLLDSMVAWYHTSQLSKCRLGVWLCQAPTSC